MKMIGISDDYYRRKMNEIADTHIDANYEPHECAVCGGECDCDLDEGPCHECSDCRSESQEDEYWDQKLHAMRDGD